MKRWLVCAALIFLVAASGYMPFSGSDVGTLQPVELISLSVSEDLITVKTDTGDMGQGSDIDSAFSDLKRTAAGKVFLETADYLLIDQKGLLYLPRLTAILRPACKVCVTNDDVDLKKAAEYLRIQADNFTLQNYRAGERSIPYLAVHEERMYIVSKEY